MSNEELAVEVKAGNRERLPELWEQVRRFVWREALRRVDLSGGMGGVTAEDLYQSGFLALAAAVDTFDPAAGRSFVGWLADYLKTAFAVAGGYRSRKQSFDPLHRAGTLDAPTRGDDLDDGDPLAELLPDPAAEAAFEAVAERDRLDRLRAAVRNAVDELPPEQRAAVIGRYWRGEAVDGKTINAALRALRHPRISRTLSGLL